MSRLIFSIVPYADFDPQAKRSMLDFQMFVREFPLLLDKFTNQVSDVQLTEQACSFVVNDERYMEPLAQDMIYMLRDHDHRLTLCSRFTTSSLSNDTIFVIGYHPGCELDPV